MTFSLPTIVLIPTSGIRASGKREEGATMAQGTEGMVQRVIREVSAGTVFPMLTKTNYSDWVLLMKVKLRARLLWTAIEKGGVKPHEDM